MCCAACSTELAAGKPSSKAGKLLGRSGKKAELHGVLGWLAKQYRVARHAARGMLNRVVKVRCLQILACWMEVIGAACSSRQHPRHPHIYVACVQNPSAPALDAILSQHVCVCMLLCPRAGQWQEAAPGSRCLCQLHAAPAGVVAGGHCHLWHLLHKDQHAAGAADVHAGRYSGTTAAMGAGWGVSLQHTCARVDNVCLCHTR